MKDNFLRVCVASILGLATCYASGAAADHLLISEVGMNGAVNHEGEYIEVFNPTTSAIDLTNYWLSDHNAYCTLPSDPDGLFETGVADNIVRFPPGTTLGSGQVLVVVGKASRFLEQHFGSQLSNYTGQTGNPLLFEVQESDAAVPNMETRNTSVGTPPDDPHAPFNWNFTNASATNGEHVKIFWWDGVADLVKDVDLVAYGNPTGGNAPIIKNPTTVGGKNGATYLQDNGSITNLTVGVVSLATRVSILEDGEPSTGGNGITGHDETMEISANSWVGGSYPGDATPGRTSLPINAGNLPPQILDVFRSHEYPTPADAITLAANVSDVDGTVSSVNFFIDSGSGFVAAPATLATGTTWSVTLPLYADDTIIKFYVQATDDDAAVKVMPPGAPASFYSFFVDATPIVPGELVINEVLYNPSGTDAGGHEWLELYNTRSTPMDVTHIQFADANKNWFSFPAATTIPANGYVILTQDLTAFNTQYGSMPAGVNVFDYGDYQLNNSPEQLYLRHLNGIDYNGTEKYVDYVPYTPDEPWPGLSGNRSMELTHPLLDNSLPESWKANSHSAAPESTPGARNSVYAGVFVSDINRDPELPTAGQAVIVTAKVRSVPGATITSAKLFFDTGSGFASLNMTLTATPDVYSATIPGQPAGTRITYYVEGTNSATDTGYYPVTAPTKFLAYYSAAVVPAASALVINEILYDNLEGDNYEFVEILNTTANPINLSDYVFTDSSNLPFLLPVGTTIGANGYVILTMDAFFFSGQYVLPGDVPLVGWNREFNLNNGATGDVVNLYHPNLYRSDGTGTTLSTVDFALLAPWPTWTNAPSNTEPDSPNKTGRSIELINPFSEARESAELWAWTTRTESAGIMGSPGAQNSVYSTSGVADWNLY